MNQITITKGNSYRQFLLDQGFKAKGNGRYVKKFAQEINGIPVYYQGELGEFKPGGNPPLNHGEDVKTEINQEFLEAHNMGGAPLWVRQSNSNEVHGMTAVNWADKRAYQGINLILLHFWQGR